MKNIHILQTDKPSRLYLHSDNELQLRTNIIRTSEDYLGSNQHIYITSNEDINDSDYVITKYGRLVRVSYLMSKDLESASNPVVLTTDGDLIKYGVQAIDDEFLEWFVKNPSCEEVEVELKTKQLVKPYDVYNEIVSYYKIIIQKEEPKQERMYSEEEVKKLIIDFLFERGIGREVENVEEWFKQFKKK